MKNSKPSKKEAINNFNTIKLLYERASNDWRHFDNHIWQIPSLAISINIYLVSQVFNKKLIFAQNIFSGPCTHNCVIDPCRVIRIVIVFLAMCLTIVLTIALVKHRLHEIGKTENLIKFEELLPYSTKLYNFDDPDVFDSLIPNPHYLEKKIASIKTHVVFVYLMYFTIFIDILLIVAISLFGW